MVKNIVFYKGWVEDEFNNFYSDCENMSRNKYAVLCYDYSRMLVALIVNGEYHSVLLAGNINIMDKLLSMISSLDYNFRVISRNIDDVEVPDIEPIEHLQVFQDYTGLSKQGYNHRVEVVNTLEEMLETLEGNETENARKIAEEIYDKYFKGKSIKSEDELLDSHLDAVVINIGSVIKLGFDPKCSLSEVAKHINSRRGTIINGKFTKSKDPEDMRYWYIPNFKKCKRSKQ
jgi:hypothetical protein